VIGRFLTKKEMNSGEQKNSIHIFIENGVSKRKIL